MTLTNDNFEYVCDFIRERSAIVLETGKEYLVESRLTPVARSVGVDTINELVAQLRKGSVDLQAAVVEAMTTNETSWFRDHHPFDVLRTAVIPYMVDRRAATKTLRIWSAACSTGQEPYSIAMILRESFPQLAGWKVDILATDLSNDVLEKAREGKYAQLEANRGLPATTLVKWFDRDGMGWRLKQEIRSAVEFKQFNLVRPWPPTRQWDIVMCRNVLIYFDPATKSEVLGRIHKVLAPDGFMMLGAAETTLNLHSGFERVPYEKAGCFRPKP